LHWIVVCLHLTLAAFSGLHAMLYKRDSRAALGWVSVCLFFPVVGSLLYYMFGINRIQTQARKLAGPRFPRLHVGHERGSFGGGIVTADQTLGPQLGTFARISDRVTSRPLSTANAVEMLKNGEQAYPRMLAAIDSANRRVWLATYLFESDSIGLAFVDALTAARQRGIEVRVIVDGLGELYSWPRASRILRRAGVRVVRFLPPKLFPPAFSVNLRNHRKILLVDGAIGFSGGMNIGARHLVETNEGQRTADLHFRIQGPVVAQLEDIFIEDWHFTTKEELQPTGYRHEPSGPVFCRCISDGPNEDLDKIAMTMMGAISAARREIIILTPYFLPTREMIASFQSAALRGVDVAIILPEKSNLRFIDWATRNLLWELLQYGVKIYYQPPPFAHTKLFVIDGVYAQIGSANIDSRSLRLNFELNIEIYDTEFSTLLAGHCWMIRQAAAETTLEEVDKRRLATRFRDAACWLFMPYL
jgi:cardiolipin synthase